MFIIIILLFSKSELLKFLSLHNIYEQEKRIIINIKSTNINSYTIK